MLIWSDSFRSLQQRERPQRIGLVSFSQMTPQKRMTASVRIPDSIEFAIHGSLWGTMIDPQPNSLSPRDLTLFAQRPRVASSTAPAEVARALVQVLLTCAEGIVGREFVPRVTRRARHAFARTWPEGAAASLAGGMRSLHDQDSLLRSGSMQRAVAQRAKNQKRIAPLVRAT